MPLAPEPRRRAGRIVAVAGGKGGVGKSLVALNLAIVLGRLGHRTMLIDGDLGAPTLHTMLGATRLGPGLGGFLDHEVASLTEAAIDVDAPNLKLVPGSARAGAANINAGQKLRLLRAIAGLAVDVVVLDVGAGAAYNTIDLVTGADLKLVVMTPQLTSLQNAYGFLKQCVQRSLRRLPEEAEQRRLLDELTTGDAERLPVQRVVAILRGQHEQLADAMVDVLDRFGVLLVGNMLTSPSDHNVLARISTMISDYLMVTAPVVAALPLSDDVRRSIDRRVPVALSDTARDSQVELRRLARVIMDADIARLRTAGRPGGADQTLPIWIERELAPPR